MPKYQPSYHLEFHEFHKANVSRCYRSIGNEENLSKYLRHDTIYDFDYNPFNFNVDDTIYTDQNENNSLLSIDNYDMQNQDDSYWDEEEATVIESLPQYIRVNHFEYWDYANDEILETTTSKISFMQNDEEMWDADDLPTPQILSTPDQLIRYKKKIQSYNKRNRYEVKRNKQGLKRLLTLKKKQVKTFFTKQHPEQQQTFTELLKIGVHPNDIYLLQNACKKYKYENFNQILQSRNIYHYNEVHEFRDKRVKKHNHEIMYFKDNTQKIKLELTTPTEKLLRVLLGLTIFKYIDKAHEKAIAYGLDMSTHEHEHDKLLKKFYTNKYLFKQISTQLYTYYTDNPWYLNHVKKYHMTETMLINSQYEANF
jgi:hypothetical protein